VNAIEYDWVVTLCRHLSTGFASADIGLKLLTVFHSVIRRAKS